MGKNQKKLAWTWFSKFIRLRDALETTGTKTDLKCISCNKRVPAFGKGCAQAGHFIPGRGNSILIDESGVHGQCYNCNINLKGNWVAYERALWIKIGQDEVAKLKQKKFETRKVSQKEWQEIAELYQRKYKELDGN